MSRTAGPGAPFAPSARRRLITIACLLAQFMAAVESTIVGTAMPTIVGDLGGFHLFSWVFAAYLLAQAVSTPVYGRLADVYGRKRVFFAGASLFLAASAACGFAWGMVPLIVFRAVQGLGAGAIQPIAWTIIGDIYAPADRARMQGWLSSVFGASAIAGPALGAFIVQHLHWALVFWVNLPIGLAAILMLAYALEERLEPARRRIDYAGAILLMLGVGALLVAIVQSQTLGGAVIAGLGAGGAAALAALTWHELRVAEPIVPFRLWRHPLIAIGNFGALTIGIMMMCNSGYLPAYVQGAMGESPAVAGFVVGSSSVVWTIGTILGARVMIRTSYRAAGVTGSLILLVGTAILLALEPARGPLWAAFGAATLGLGMGFCNTTFIVSVQTAVGWGERGAITGANLFMRTIGQALGAALFGFMLPFGIARHVPDAGDAVNQLLQPDARQRLAPAVAARLSDAFAAAMHDNYLILGLFALVVLGFTFCIPARLSPTRHAIDPRPRPEPGPADD
jgi:EmrB/QacA subfamily drug resistance transporter